jgi:hypothetical protein
MVTGNLIACVVLFVIGSKITEYAPQNCNILPRNIDVHMGLVCMEGNLHSPNGCIEKSYPICIDDFD